jgi:hypothetical protein
MRIDGREYSLLMGSDVERDGMFLELYEGADAHSGSPLAEYFYSDVDGSMTLTEYERGVPAAALAWLQSEGARRLPPAPSTA